MTNDRIYLLDKGGTCLWNLYNADELELVPVDEDGNIEVAKFEDFNVYFIGGYGFNVFINVKSVILPPDKEVIKDDVSRVYLLVSNAKWKKNICLESPKFYILPELNYPKSKMPDFLKYLKKQVKNFPEVRRIFNKNEDPIGCGLEIPRKNLRSMVDIREYFESIKNGKYKDELRNFITDEYTIEEMERLGLYYLSNGEPEVINSVTQDMVDRFLKDINNRYTVTR